jgi:hypothetical protein
MGAGAYSLDELMKEREAVAELHKVLMEALRALAVMCGIEPEKPKGEHTIASNGEERSVRRSCAERACGLALWWGAEPAVPETSTEEPSVAQPNRMLIEISLQDGTVRQTLDTKR